MGALRVWCAVSCGFAPPVVASRQVGLTARELVGLAGLSPLLRGIFSSTFVYAFFAQECEDCTWPRLAKAGINTRPFEWTATGRWVVFSPPSVRLPGLSAAPVALTSTWTRVDRTERISFSALVLGSAECRGKKTLGDSPPSLWTRLLKFSPR